MEDFELIDELSRIADVEVPKAVEEIRTASVLHTAQCDVDEMEATVKKWLNIQE